MKLRLINNHDSMFLKEITNPADFWKINYKLRVPLQCEKPGNDHHSYFRLLKVLGQRIRRFNHRISFKAELIFPAYEECRAELRLICRWRRGNY